MDIFSLKQWNINNLITPVGTKILNETVADVICNGQLQYSNVLVSVCHMVCRGQKPLATSESGLFGSLDCTSLYFSPVDTVLFVMVLV